jgi:FMNH2-dependent dimethyl sulfone monooxygenase
MTGRHFAAKNCDMIFVHIKGEDIESARKDIDEVRKLAREEYGREIQVWANTYCVLGDSDNEAFDFRDYYVKEQGDWVAIDNLVTGIGLNSKVLPPHMLEAAKYHFIAGFGGYPLVGTKERIASEMVKLSEVGLDGALMSWPRYEEGITRFIDEVMPLLVQVGLRAP